MIDVAVAVKFTARTEPKNTYSDKSKPVPVIVTTVSPEVGPDVGDIPITDGAAGGDETYWYAPALQLVVAVRETPR